MKEEDSRLREKEPKPTVAKAQRCRWRLRRSRKSYVVVPPTPLTKNHNYPSERGICDATPASCPYRPGNTIRRDGTSGDRLGEITGAVSSSRRIQGGYPPRPQ